MTKAFFAGTLAALLCVLLPLAAARSHAQSAEAPTPQPVRGEASPEVFTAEQETQPTQADLDGARLLTILADGQLRRMTLREYLTGVLLAELPSSFSTEAMKAQATACRTYALKREQRPKHGAAAVCTEAGCCQGWKDPALCDPAAVEKARQAVAQTDGMVIVYDGQLIDATFFSCSGGRTEDAAAVWGSELPYLRAVDSPGEEQAKHDSDALSVPLEEFVSVLRRQSPEADLSGPTSDWIGQIEYTNGGGVASIELGGRPFSGKQLRSLFHLNATAFTLELRETEAVFHTRGFGHRVGMSQYGAEAMAQAGADYVEILQHYYQGVSVERVD